MAGGSSKHWALLLGVSALLIYTTSDAAPQGSGETAPTTFPPTSASCLSVEKCAVSLRVPVPTFSHKPEKSSDPGYLAIFNDVLAMVREQSSDGFCASLVAGTTCFEAKACGVIYKPLERPNKLDLNPSKGCSCDTAAVLLMNAVDEMATMPECNVGALGIDPGFRNLIDSLENLKRYAPSRPVLVDPTPSTPIAHDPQVTPPSFTLEYEGEERYVNTGRPVFQGTGEKGGAVSIRVFDRSESNWSTRVHGIVGPTRRWKIGEDAYKVELPDGEYTVKASLTSRDGQQSLTKTIDLVVDTLPPFVAVQSPTAGALVQGSSLDIRLQIEYGSTAVVHLCGQRLEGFEVDGNSWSKSVEWPVEGPCKLSVIARDRVGNVSESVEVSFIIDNSPPKLEVLNPANGARVNQSRPVIEGVAELGSTISAEIDGAKLKEIVLQGTRWRIGPEHFPRNLVERDEPYVLRIYAEDQNGRKTYKAIRLVIDTTPPQIAVDSPAEVDLDDGQPFFSGTAEPGSKVVVRIDGQEYATDQPVTQSGKWVIKPAYDKGALSTGRHQVSVAATDQAGNTAYAHSFGRDGFIDIDTSLPRIEDIEVDFSRSKKRPVFKGRSKRWSAVRVALDGKDVGVFDAGREGGWRTDPSTYQDLAAGTHSLEVSATDRAGRTSKKVKKDFSIESDILLGMEALTELRLNLNGATPYAALAVEISSEPRHGKLRPGFMLIGAVDATRADLDLPRFESLRVGVYNFRSGFRLHLDYVSGPLANSVYALLDTVVVDEGGWIESDNVRLRAGMGAVVHLSRRLSVRADFAPEFHIRLLWPPGDLVRRSEVTRLWLSAGLRIAF